MKVSEHPGAVGAGADSNTNQIQNQSQSDNNSDQNDDGARYSSRFNNRFQIGRWRENEHRRFIEALKKYGKDWGKVQQYVGTRSSTQARSHAQKFFQRLQKQNQAQDDFINELREDDEIKPEYLIEYAFDSDSVPESENPESCKSDDENIQNNREEVKEELSHNQDFEDNDLDRAPPSNSPPEQYKRLKVSDSQEVHLPQEQNAPTLQKVAMPPSNNEQHSEQKVRYAKDTKKRYLEDIEIRHSRIFSIIDSNHPALHSHLESNLSNMSFCILSYNGPAHLVPEEKFLGIENSDYHNGHDINSDYLRRGRQKVAKMLNLDTRKLSGGQMCRNMIRESDAYLLEVKAYERNSLKRSQSTGKDPAAHKYFMVHQSGDGRPSGKRVPINMIQSHNGNGHSMLPPQNQDQNVYYTNQQQLQRINSLPVDQYRAPELMPDNQYPTMQNQSYFNFPMMKRGMN